MATLSSKIFMLLLLVLMAMNVQSQRPGTCPSTGPLNGAMQCNYDAMCPNGQKCCSIGATSYFYCATAITGSGGSVVKPGTCPAVPPGTAGICIAGCANDQSCSGNYKCCSNGCGTVCTAPSSTSTGSKPGNCLYVTPYSSCSSYTRYCTSDVNCGGSLKCCSNGCGTQCLNPVSGNTGSSSGSKQGSCPMMTAYQGGCTNQCTQDYNCYGAQKCCRNNCANICVNPANTYGK